MKYILVTVLLFAGALAAPLASQGPTNKNPWIYGHGTHSCGQWTTDRANAERGQWHNANVTWMLGFITAVSMINDRPLATSDSEAMTRWMDNYCAANPLVRLADASKALGQALIDAY